MRRTHLQTIAALLVFTALALTSCVKDNFELKEKFSDQIEWNPSLALPIATADMTIANLAKERPDTLEYVSEKTLGYGTNDDDKVVQFRYMIDTARTIDVMHLPTLKPYHREVALKPVEISDVSFPIGYVTLHDVLEKNFSSADYLDYYNAIQANPNSIYVEEKHSSNDDYRYPVGNVPPIMQAYFNSMYGEEINIKDVFEYILLQSGKITLTLRNSTGLNINCEVVLGSYNEQNEWVEFGTFDFKKYPNWVSQGTEKRTIMADDSYLNSDFYFSFKNFTIADAKNAKINDWNGTEGFLLTLQMEDMVAISGKAKVPLQELQDTRLEWITVHDEDAQGRKLYNVLLEKGKFHYEITSTIKIATELTAIFSTVDSLGVTPVRKSAMMTNEHPTYSNDWDMTGCNIDLTTNPEQPYNSLPVTIDYKVHTTGGMLEFNCNTDKIVIDITNTDSLFFAYLEGDLGKFDQDIFSETLDFDLKDYLGDFMSVESLVLYDPKVNITYDNPVGIAGDLELNLVGKDDKGNSVDLFGGHENKWRVVRPTCELAKQGKPESSGIYINKTTSNIVDFVKMLPNKIEYSGIFHVNSDVPDGTPILNCVSNKGKAKLGVSIELPLNLSAKNFVLQEDVDLDLSDLDDLSCLERVRLYINTDHQFPIDANLKISLLDTTAAQPVLGTLPFIVLESAKTSGMGKVARNETKHTESEVTLEKDSELLQNFKKANKLRLEVFLETENHGGNPVIFYSYYGLKFNMAADCKFIYTSK
ncbi:MAG: hypothetical protein J6W37_01040 [Bacteroidales bacterium]|nr:hypothetical protein [Bacteroidales bacterium]